MKLQALKLAPVRINVYRLHGQHATHFLVSDGCTGPYIVTRDVLANIWKAHCGNPEPLTDVWIQKWCASSPAPEPEWMYKLDRFDFVFGPKDVN